MGSRNPARVVKRWALVAAVAFQAQTVVASETCTPDGVFVRGERGVARFSVEVADSGQERAQGLMFREHMATMSGMLFVYDAPGPAAFWMKNTLIPLDMLFIDQTGKVTRIHEGAEPGNLTPIEGGDDVQFVLEINAGMAHKLGLAEGAVLRHPAIPAATAAWPCD